MKLALIPPICRLQDTLASSIQLMLPHLVTSLAYRTCYHEHGDNPLQQVILDNGLAEGKKLHPTSLLHMAVMYNASELVVQDVMGDGPATVEAATDFFNSINGVISAEVNYAIVAQGRNVQESLETVKRIIDKHRNFITAVHIPRRLMQDDAVGARIELAHLIYKYWPDVDIHLLGASHLWLRELEVASTVPYIRSMDTSMPYVLAKAGIEMRTHRKVDLPQRGSDPDYFTNLLTDEQDQLADYNVATMFSWLR